MLWGAAGLAVAAGMPQLGVAIAVIVVVNAGFALGQEYRADRAAQRLQELLPLRHRPAQRNQAGSGSFGLTGHAPRTAWMSVRHRPAASTRTNTCPGPGSGRGTSSITSGA